MLRMPESRASVCSSMRPSVRSSVRAAFDKAAPAYDDAASVQREAGDRLATFAHARLAANPLTARAGTVALDAGCGTGHGFAHIGRLCPQHACIALDLAPAMLQRARALTAPSAAPSAASAVPQTLWPLCADLEQLPLADGSVALLWSSLAVQWCQPQAAMAEFARVLAANGCALIATLGPRTLHELDAAFAVVDDARHRNHFHRLEEWAAQAAAHGLQVEACETRDLHAHASELGALLKAIKAIGAATVLSGRRHRPLGPQAWRQVQQAYEIHRGADGLLSVTYELLLLALRKPA